MARADGWTSRILGLAGLFVVAAGLHLGQELFQPLALSVLFSLVLSPLVHLGLKAGLPRFVAVVGVVLLAFGCLGLLSYFMAGQAAALGQKLPEYKANIRAKLDPLRGPFSRTVRSVREAVKEVDKPAGPQDPLKVQVVDGVPDPFRVASAVVGPLLTLGGAFALVVLLVIFFLLYEDDIRDRVIRLAGDAEVSTTTQTITDAARGVSRFLFLQACVNASYGAALSLGLFSVGVPNALLWGFLAGLLRFVPYVGPVAGGALPVLLSVAVFPGWSRAALVLGIIVGIEAVTANFVEPLLYGKRTGLSPLAVILAAVFWAWMWGGVGLILAVPLTVSLLSVSRNVPALRFLAVMFGDEPLLEPKVRIYQRLLSGHQEEAAELLEKELAEGKPLATVFDGSLLGVLRMAQADLRRGTLDVEKSQRLYATLREIVDDLTETARAARKEAPAPDVGAALCLPASDPADEISAYMLVRALGLEGCRAAALAADKTAGESLEAVRAEGADVLILCLSPLSNLLRARYLYKRLRRRFGDIPVVEGVWGGGEARGIEGRVAPDGKAAWVTTLEEAVRVVAGLAREAAVRRKLKEDAA